MMLPASARLLRLVSLLQTRRYWSGSELAAQLEIDVRTLRRDVGRLRTLGYPVQAATGVGGGYQLGAGAELPPVLLDDDEAVAVAVALRAASASIAGIEETAVRLLAKLDQLLPSRLRKRASALHAVMLSLGTPQLLPDAEVLTRTAAACRDHACLQFNYRNHQGRTSLRSVEPMRLANYGRRWYLVAWDREREDWRTFRVDRMDALLATGQGYTPRTQPQDLGAFVERAIRYAPDELRIRLKLLGDAAQLAAQLPVWIGTLEAIDTQHCILHSSAGSIDGLIAQMVMVGIEFELLDAAGLQPELDKALQRLHRGISGPSAPSP